MKLIKDTRHFKVYRQAEGTYIPYHFVESLSTLLFENLLIEFEVVERVIVDHPNSMTVEPKVTQPSQNSQPNKEISYQVFQIPHEIPSDIPSSSHNDYFDIHATLDNLCKNNNQNIFVPLVDTPLLNQHSEDHLKATLPESDVSGMLKAMQASVAALSLEFHQQDLSYQKSIEQNRKETLDLQQISEQSIISLFETVADLISPSP